jgi:charged multivesicular body protein 7
VVNDALARKEWLALKEYLEMRESLYYKGWGVRIPGVGEVVYWGLRQLGLTFGEGKMPTGRVIVVENLETAGKEVMRRFDAAPKGRIERIFSRAAFAETFGDILGERAQLSDSDTEVLLKFLARDKGVLVYDSETVKFKAPNDTEQEITNEDSTITALKTLIRDLETQITILEKRADVLANTARDAVARKNRVSALAALRSKKLAESTLVKRHATLAQLEEVFAKIEQAADQVELVRVMEASTKVLSGLNKEVGGVERVDGVVDRLREEMGVVDEIGEIVGELGKNGAVDEGEVDDELEVMEREERERREAIERKEKETREKREAEETRKKLDALEAVEREAREKENARQQTEQSTAVNTEKEIEDSTLGMKRMSLDPPAAEPV